MTDAPDPHDPDTDAWDPDPADQPTVGQDPPVVSEGHRTRELSEGNGADLAAILRTWGDGDSYITSTVWEYVENVR